jgi:hypothetical protein
LTVASRWKRNKTSSDTTVACSSFSHPIIVVVVVSSSWLGYHSVVNHHTTPAGKDKNDYTNDCLWGV